MKLRIHKGIFLWTLIMYLFLFQRVLTSNWNVLNYMDELFTIGVAMVLLLRACLNKLRLTKEEWGVLGCWIVICIIGLWSNTVSGLLSSPFLICVDALSMLKVWLAFYTLIMTDRSSRFYDDLIIAMARIGRALTVFMFACLIISQFADIGMTGRGKRYGMYPFNFLFEATGNYSKLFYFLIPLLTADLYYKSNLYKKMIIALALVCWAFTLRARAFAFIAVYLLLAAWFFMPRLGKSSRHMVKKIKLYHVVIVVVLAVIIAWDKVIFYFTTDTQARSMLLRYGIITMLNYFPLGSGFGTYGSDIAATHYSPLYMTYRFYEIRGMQPDASMYLNDNYWPMVMGQFGFFGLLLAAFALFLLMKRILKDTQNNKYLYFACFAALGFLFLSSVASKSYSEYSSICVFMLLAVFVKRERAKKIEQYNGGATT